MGSRKKNVKGGGGVKVIKKKIIFGGDFVFIC